MIDCISTYWIGPTKADVILIIISFSLRLIVFSLHLFRVGPEQKLMSFEIQLLMLFLDSFGKTCYFSDDMLDSLDQIYISTVTL